MEATANVLAACEAAQEKRELVSIDSHRGRWIHSLANGFSTFSLYMSCILRFARLENQMRRVMHDPPFL